MSSGFQLIKEIVHFQLQVYHLIDITALQMGGIQEQVQRRGSFAELFPSHLFGSSHLNIEAQSEALVELCLGTTRTTKLRTP